MPIGGEFDGGDFGVVVQQRCGVNGLWPGCTGGSAGGAGGNGWRE